MKQHQDSVYRTAVTLGNSFLSVTGSGTLTLGYRPRPYGQPTLAAAVFCAVNLRTVIQLFSV